MVHPLIKQFMDVFEGQVVRVDPAVSQIPAPHFKPQNPSEATANEVPLHEALRKQVARETAAAE